MPRRKRLYCEKREFDDTGHLPKQFISATQMRELFNKGNYFDRFWHGEFLACLRKEHTPNSIDEPPNSRSLTLDYLNRDGSRVCRVHLYLRPDGTIGGRDGRPDPKQMIVDGVKYVLGPG